MVSIHPMMIYSRYFQFAVMDESYVDDASALGAAQWTDEALDRMLACGRNAILPGTLRNVAVRVEIHVLEEAPQLAREHYDHLVEGALEAPSGTLAVAGTARDMAGAKRIAVEPGWYRFLYAVSGSDTIAAAVGTKEPARDVYSLYLWPGDQRVPRLLKHWNTASALAV